MGPNVTNQTLHTTGAKCGLESSPTKRVARRSKASLTVSSHSWPEFCQKMPHWKKREAALEKDRVEEVKVEKEEEKVAIEVKKEEEDVAERDPDVSMECFIFLRSLFTFY